MLFICWLALAYMSNRPEKDAVLEDMKGALAPLMEDTDEEHREELPLEEL